MSDALDAALGGIPMVLRSRIISSYTQLKSDFVEGRFELAGLNAGKLCEVSLRVLQHATTGSYLRLGKKIDNFADECRKIVTSPKASAEESIRTVVPRALVFLYTMRNKRGIGHVGGDVEANKIDAETIARTADWVVCELIRVYHKVSLEEAQDLVNSLAVRKFPEVWSVGSRRRVLRKGLSAKQQVLLLLYSEVGEFVLVEDLCDWVEYSQPSMFKRNVARPLHRERLVEYDEEEGLVYLSPLGVKEVEKEILKPTI